ncbi:hypothetical protein SXCC_01673 [Gluconacetobacter sp. SXCC-1]|nr:hypothetical protein SXCC_01673 [Gluconacetobacter sp. SXCC-1]
MCRIMPDGRDTYAYMFGYMTLRMRYGIGNLDRAQARQPRFASVKYYREE